MTALLIKSDPLLHNPLDVAEGIMMDREWSFDRPAEGELIAEAGGAWTNYRLWFNWNEEMNCLTVACAFDNKMPKQVLPKVYALLAHVNEKIWVGYFNVNPEDCSVTFRHALMMNEGFSAAAEQLKSVLDIAIEECERFYPAFQSVVWGGKSPAEALEIAMFDTVAEA